ncbi:hypothetical protein D3C76_658340 [compost metagenome]
MICSGGRIIKKLVPNRAEFIEELVRTWITRNPQSGKHFLIRDIIKLAIEVSGRVTSEKGLGSCRPDPEMVGCSSGPAGRSEPRNRSSLRHPPRIDMPPILPGAVIADCAHFGI